MESEARYTLVGATVVALVIAAVGAILWLKGAGAREQVDRYSIYFQRQSLDGLQVGAPVTMLGIAVGRVEGYTVDTRTMNRVLVTVRVDPRTPVTPATTAIVQRNLLTGIARIALSPPAQAGAIQPHTVVPPGEEHPVIAEGVSDIDQIADAANRVAKSGAIALDNINAVLSVENRAAVTQTLANVRDITSALNARMERLDGTMAALNRTVADVGQAGREFTDTARELRGAAGPALAQANTTLRNLSQAVGRFERDAGAVTQRLDAALEVGALELGATSREIRSAATLLARTVDRVRDPRTLLFGPSAGQLGPGERLE
jgi:phospholipid/cholesterol/gamma-HCH transport system substrate-binding protein